MSVRTSRILALIAALFGIATAGGAGATAVVSPAIASPTAAPARAASSSSGPLTARLRVANRNPRQLHGVLFNASGSSGPIAEYDFVYGDGVTEVSQVPEMMHGYRKAGTFHATVYVLDSAGNAAHSASVTIHVSDGIPPVVAISSPRANQHIVLGGQGIALRGTATDAGGVKTVQLAIQLTSYPPHFKVPSGYCVWYDGKSYLVASACGNPYYFTAPFGHGHWSFTIPGKALIPAGTYFLRVRATDHAGNVSSFFAVSLRTVIPFALRRK